MKKILIFIGIFASIKFVSQTTYTWTGATDSDFFTASNWNPSTGTPGGNDNALFNSGSVGCNIGSGIAIVSMSLMSGYTGVVDMGSSYHTISGNLVVNSGTLISTSNVLEIDIANSASTGFSLGGGVFINNAGSIDVYSNSGSNFAFSGNLVLATLNLYTSGGSTASRTIDFGSNLTTDDLFFNSFATKVYDFQGTIHIKNSLDLGNSSHAIVSASNNGNFIFDGSTASIIGSTSAGSGKAYLPNIQISTIGAYSITRSLNILGNWVVTSGNLTAGTSTVNMYGTSASISGTAAAFSNLTIQAGATVSMPASAEVKVGNALTMTGTLNFQTTSALGLNGTGAQAIALGGKTLAAINAYNTGSARAVTLSGAIVILDSISAQTNVTLNTGGSLTLRSNASQTARVGRLGGVISGNVTVETFIPGPFTGWANLGVRGVTGQSVANWDTHLSSGGANGIPMTCSLCSYPSDALGSWFNSIQRWDEPSSSYDSLTVNSALNPGAGYWVYVGDGQSSTNGLTLINTGVIAQGNINVPVSDGGSGGDQGFNLVANPYASPISTTKLFQGGLNPFDFPSAEAHMWNADLFSGTGGYVTINGVISTPGGFNVDVIPGGQGFYVFYQPIFLSGVLSFSDDMKVDNSGGAAPLLKSVSSNSLSYFRLKLDGVNDGDETVISIDANATAFYDKLDARKILKTPGYIGYPGDYTRYTTLSSKDANGLDYSINTLPTLNKNTNVPLMVHVSASGTYTLSSFDFNNFENCLVLIDKLDNSYHDLRVSPYSFTISDTTSAPRFELVLCKNQIDVVTAIEETKNSTSSININQDEQGAFVKTNFSQNTKATISVFNIMGQKLMEDIQVEGTVTNTQLNLNLHNQVVFIRVTSEKESTTRKMVLH